MSRTINGKCTGMAARIEKQALRDQAQWEDALWLEEYNRVARELMDIDPDCETWFFARPEQTKGEMFPLMVERIEQLKIGLEVSSDQQADARMCARFGTQL